MSLPPVNPDVVNIALLCGLLLGAAYVVMGVLSFVPKTAQAIRATWPTMFSATFTIGVILSLFLFGGGILTIALVLFAARIGFEAFSVGLARDNLALGVNWPRALGAVTGLVVWLAMQVPLLLTVEMALVGLGVTLSILALRKGAGKPRISGVLEVLAYPILPLIIFAAAANRSEYAILILGAYVLVETFDSYALLGGKAIGKTPAFPTLSPRKTIEGLGVGALMLMLTAAAIALVIRPEDLVIALGIAAISGGLTLAGDLLASRLKRRTGVKDYPKVLTHQGGLLDIVDSWIATGAGLAILASVFWPLS